MQRQNNPQAHSKTEPCECFKAPTVRQEDLNFYFGTCEESFQSLSQHQLQEHIRAAERRSSGRSHPEHSTAGGRHASPSPPRVAAGKAACGAAASSSPSELSKFKAFGRCPAAFEARQPPGTTAKGSPGTHAEPAACPASGQHHTQGGHLPVSPRLHEATKRWRFVPAPSRTKNIRSSFAGPKPRDRNSSGLKQDHKSRTGRRLWLPSAPQPQTKALPCSAGWEHTQPPPGRLTSLQDGLCAGSSWAPAF